jgi:hypothetical protein
MMKKIGILLFFLIGIMCVTGCVKETPHDVPHISVQPTEIPEKQVSWNISFEKNDLPVILYKNYCNKNQCTLTGSVPSQPTSIRAARLWIIGDRFVSVVTSPVTGNRTFSFPIAPALMENLNAQRYDLIIQFPAASNRFDIAYDETVGTVIDTTSGELLVTSSELQAMNRSDIVTLLKNALNTPEVSDTYFEKILVIEDYPWIHIDPVGDHSIGDVFNVTGTTNLPVGDKIHLEIYPSTFKTGKTLEFRWNVSSTVTVSGDENRGLQWLLKIKESMSARPDEYYLEACWVQDKEICGDYQLFNLLEVSQPNATVT